MEATVPIVLLLIAGGLVALGYAQQRTSPEALLGFGAAPIEGPERAAEVFVRQMVVRKRPLIRQAHSELASGYAVKRPDGTVLVELSGVDGLTPADQASMVTIANLASVKPFARLNPGRAIVDAQGNLSEPTPRWQVSFSS